MTNEQKQKFLSICNIELAFRKDIYPQQIEDQLITREDAGNRYRCLVTAVHMVTQGKPPAETKPLPEVLEEISRWMKEIQRNATPATMRGDGQRIAHLTAFIEHFSPEPEKGRVVQTELF